MSNIKILLSCFTIFLNTALAFDFEDIENADSSSEEILDIFDLVDDDKMLSYPKEEESSEKGKLVEYADDKKSYIAWESISTKEWLDIKNWKINLSQKEKLPNWEIIRRDLSHIETVGRVLECIGQCKLYKGLGFANSQFRSRIEEGDEIYTSDNSYAWIFLVDGTLMRLAPNTSISFKEINISKDKFFFYIRHNVGNFIWLDRSSDKYKEIFERETDPVFFPLSLFEANSKVEKIKIDENNLFSFFRERKTHLNKYKKLNNLIEENNFVVRDKKTIALISLPNANIIANDKSFESISLFGGKSYLKSFTKKSLGLESSEQDEKIDLYTRGYVKTSRVELEPDVWYKIDQKGRNVEKISTEESSAFYFGNFIVSRIPTILMAREFMLKRYSLQLFNRRFTPKLMAKWKYRLWDHESNSTDEIQKRLAFLKEYTRREETSLLFALEKLTNRMRQRGDKISAMEYNSSFYELAMNSYMLYGEKKDKGPTDESTLNSTKKLFWKYINVHN